MNDSELERFSQLMQQWKEDLKQNEQMNALFMVLMYARDNIELNEIIWQNLDFLVRNPKYFKLVNNARKRINRLRKTKNRLTEIIYKN